MFASLLRQTADIYAPVSVNSGWVQTINRNHIWSFPARLSIYSKPWLIDLSENKQRYVQVRERLLFLKQDVLIQKGYKVTIDDIDYETTAVSVIWDATNPHHKECILRSWG